MTGSSEPRLRLLYDLGCAFAARIQLDDLVPLVLTKCREVLEAEGAAVLLLDAERGDLYFPYLGDGDPDLATRLHTMRFPADRGIAGAVVQSGRALRVDDVSADPRFYPEIDRHSGRTTRATLVAPLTGHTGTIGVVQVVNRRDGSPFTEDDLAFLSALAGSIAVAIENARLYAHVKAAEERLRTQVAAMRRDLARQTHFGEIIGTAPAMREVFRLMESAAASPIAVLIEGETGTGKELVARGIHRASPRAEAPFLAVNCAALSESLLESELFGHRRGAFTGALQDRRGLFEAASGGTVFLDEIGEMPLAMQPKLLRVLQEGEVTPVGDNRPRTVDVRVVSATNRDLAAEVEAGRFREDVFYRLAAFPIRLPALRERREDVPLIADRILAQAAQRHGKRIAGIEPDAMALLLRHEWRGNVRELQNEVERAVALALDGGAITVEHLSRRLTAEVPVMPLRPVDDATTTPTTGDVTPLRNARVAFEASYIADALRRHRGNVSRTAQALGLSRVMLQKKMKDYGLRSP